MITANMTTVFLGVCSEQEECMAESSGDNASGITKEAINLVRLFLLMVKATEALRVKFDEEFSPHSLQTELNNVKKRILESLKKKRIINHTQWLLLFPAKGSAKSSTFDLSLMTCLLRHLASLTIGDMLPVNTDTTLCADISRLKYYRNIVHHSDNGTLSDNLFLEYWTDISQAIIRLGGSKFKQICYDLKIRKLNDDDIKELTCLCDTIPKGKKKIYDKIVGKWKQENVIETRIIKQISKLVETEPVILAIGPSGCGKSTAIRRVAVDLQRQKEFRILPAKSAEDIVNYYNPDIQQVFVIDDLCGKATIDTNKVTKWYDYSNEINEIIYENKVRILASCRVHIFQDRLLQPIGLLRKAALCDFLSEDFCLTETERNKIASSYLTKEETDQLSKISNISRYNFFPLLCNLYSRNRKGDIIEFFENPTQAIRDELDLLFKADNQKTYGTLMLFIVYNNYLAKNLLNGISGIKPILETINDTLHLNSNFSIEVVKSELENLQNFYVKNDTNAYSLIHDKIFDILVCFQGEHDFDILIDIAHTDVIRDRFLLTSLSENDSDNCHDKVLMIPVEKEETYLCRLFKDIKEGFLEKVFLNKNLACTTFRERLIEKINTLSNFNELLYNASSEKIYFLVLFMLHNGYYDTVPLLITEHVDLNKIYNIGETPLFVAVNEGYSEIVNLFLNNNVNPNIPSWYTYRPIQETPRGAHNSIANVGNTFQKKHFLSKKHKLSRTSSTRVIDISLEKRSTKIKKYKITPLYIATSHGSVDIVEMLLKHQADPNIENMCDNETPLYIATVGGDIEIVTLLLQFRACPNFYDKFNRTPLYIAAEKGHDDIVKVLLEYNGEPNTRINRCLSGDMKIPLHIASKNGHVNIVTLLLQYKADPCIKDRSGKTALYLASAEHHTDIVKLLLEGGAYTESICCIDNNSPISIASEKGYADIVKLLLNNKADPNIRDECYKTSLYLSSARHHTDVVKLLLENGAHTETICSVDNNSPISVASQNGYADIVTLLLKFNADPNIRDKYYRSALYLASAGHHPDVVKILLQYGANRNIICSKDNNSPISIASEKGYGDIVKLLEYVSFSH